MIRLYLVIIISGFSFSACTPDYYFPPKSELHFELSKSWFHPETVNGYFGVGEFPTFNPQIVVNESGRAALAVTTLIQGVTRLYVAQKGVDGWDIPETDDYLSFPSSHASHAQIGIDDSGNIVVTWIQSANGKGRLYLAEYVDGVWSKPLNMSDAVSFNFSNVLSQSMKVNGEGDVIISWVQLSQLDMVVFVSERENGVWTHPSGLQDHVSPLGSHSSNSVVAINRAGEKVVAWQQKGSGINTEQIFLSEKRHGDWEHPQTIADHVSNGEGDASAASVEINASGDTVVVWEQEEGLAVSISKSEFRNGSWEHPGTNETFSPLSLVPAKQPDLFVDPTGRTGVVWHQEGELFITEYEPDKGWDENSAANSAVKLEGGGEISFPKIAGDAFGNWTVVWIQEVNGTPRLYISEKQDGIWSHPQTVKDHLSPGAKSMVSGQPSIQLNHFGSGFLAWSQVVKSLESTQIFLSEKK